MNTTLTQSSFWGRRLFTCLLRSAAFLLLNVWVTSAYAQTDADITTKRLFEQEHWQQFAVLAPTVALRSAEFDYEYGVALAHLERWDEARAALMAGSRMSPRDKRFPIELAGVAFKQRKQGLAIAYLRRALRLDPKDEYSNEFIATLYFLQGNIEAAVKSWNRLDKPKVRQVRVEPVLHVNPALLDHAFAFAPASTLTLEELRTSDARLQALEIFPSYRFDLIAHADGTFDHVFRGQEINGWGATTVEGLLRTFRGLPLQEITPEYFNLNRSAINLVSLVRWDPDKRRLKADISGPLWQDPRWRFHLGMDARNENWDLVTSFTGPASFLGALNLRREAFTMEITRLMGARWKWVSGMELSHRDYGNVLSGTALTPAMLAQGYQLKQTMQLAYELWRSPEHRLTVSSEGSSEAGRLWAQPADSFEKLQASIKTHWFPRLRGDDFETDWQLRAGKIFGQPSFDELFMLGLERDNDLWMRAHIATRDGRKGSAPLGRNYVLSSWETDKNVYSNGFAVVKAGPFVDTGKITDLSTALGSHKWLLDTGVQLKLRVLGVGAAFSYGKDTRTGNNAFYTTLGR